MKIKNIIFDMGNVLIYFEPKLFIKNLGYHGDEAEFLLREIYMAEEWKGIDRGSISEEEAVEIFKDKLPQKYHETIKKLVLEWNQPLYQVEGMAELARKIKEAGLGVYLLSNAGMHQHDYWPRIEASKYFDGTVVSADVKQVKPEKEIYKYLFSKFSLKPEECYFIDDAPANIQAAADLGMDGFLFKDNIDELRITLGQILEIEL